jgi:hypothetical protein
MFPQQTRLLIMKDLRLFRRDPVQWSQFLIFFGLLLLYFANVDRFRQHKSDINVLTWVNIVSFLNLAVVGLILSTFTTRFIYPLISLEGRRFWILSRLPLDRDTILWGKFLFAAFGSWLPCAALVAISDVMLDVSVMVVAVHQLICLLLCLGLAGGGFWGHDAELSRAIAVEDRRGLWRDAQSGAQCAVHHGGRPADGAAMPLLPARREGGDAAEALAAGVSALLAAVGHPGVDGARGACYGAAAARRIKVVPSVGSVGLSLRERLSSRGARRLHWQT